MSRQSIGLANEPDTAADRVVRDAITAATATAFKPEVHANRIFVQEGVTLVGARTFTLPKATGSGDKYTYVNDAVQTQSIVIAALGADVFSGVAFVTTETAASPDVFLTSASSDKYTFNVTTTGGLRGDLLEAVDIASGKWLVRVFAVGSGVLATGFAAT